MPTRIERARRLGIPEEHLPDGRGKHTNQLRGKKHPNWKGGRKKIETLDKLQRGLPQKILEFEQFFGHLEQQREFWLLWTW